MGLNLGPGNDVGQFVQDRIPILTAILGQTEDGKTETDLSALGAGIARTACQTTTQSNRRSLQSIPIFGKTFQNFGQDLFCLHLEVRCECFRSSGTFLRHGPIPIPQIDR